MAMVLNVPHPRMVGRRLGSYLVEDEIGSGGMGVVYKVLDERLGRHVALKLLPAWMAAEPRRLARFEHEVRALAALNHPSIVTLHSVEEADGTHFFTMELIEGRRLSQLIPPGGFPVDELFDIALQLTDALAAAHEKGITHRDLKPDNVMIDDHGRVKILDFGLACVSPPRSPRDGTPSSWTNSSEESRGLAVGTILYMSPEQIEARAVDHRSDLFALGVVLFELASGRRPFRGDSPVQLIEAILTARPPSLGNLRPELPRPFVQVVESCLAKRRHRRPPSAQEVHDTLEELRLEVEVDLLSSRSGVRLARVRRRMLGGMAAALVAWALLAYVAFDHFLLGRGSEPAAVAPPVQRQMIAVLPFANLGSAEDEYFAAGMTEEITTRLATVESLGVISRWSASRYSSRDRDLRRVGAELGVDFVLEGTVDWARDTDGTSRVRVTPQLVRVADDLQLWADTYVHVIDDVFEVQSSIASEVIRQLDITLHQAGEEALTARPTESFEAYAAYLRGLDVEGRPGLNSDDFEAAVRMFSRAVELDPTFAAAWAHLADAHSGLYHFGFDRSEERVEAIRRAAERAVELAPDLPAARLAMGNFYYRGRRDFDRALSEYARAGRGSSEVLGVQAAVWRRQGLFEKSAAAEEAAATLSPVEPVHYYSLGITYAALQRYDVAAERFEQAFRLNPDDPNVIQWTFFNRYLETGDAAAQLPGLAVHEDRRDMQLHFYRYYFELMARHYDEALRWANTFPEALHLEQQKIVPRALARAWAHDLAGHEERARTAYEEARAVLLAELAERPDDSRLHGALALVEAGLGNGSEALRLGSRAIELQPMSQDAFEAPFRIEEMARVHVQLGQLDAAFERLEWLLATPNVVLTRPVLENSPFYDPLRGTASDEARAEARYKTLVGGR